MIHEPIHLLADDEASMLADLAQLTPEPAALAALLSNLGYSPQTLEHGLYAPGLPPGSQTPALLFPLYSRAGLAARKRDLVGRQISRSATIAAGLAALRSAGRRPPLLFLAERQAPPDGIRAEQIVSLEGGVVPRIWRHCFGSFDVLVRVTGQPPHPGLPNIAINAIESAVPILQALLHLKSDIQLRTFKGTLTSDAPLRPRVTISAAHGGSRGSMLPTVFDILVNRRYLPEERAEAALEEIGAVISDAAPRHVRVEVAMTQHDAPVSDPDAGSRSREQRALAAGWGWPQVSFCTTSTLMPGAIVLGGLERPECDPDSDVATTTLDEMSALARTLRALLLDS